MYVLCNCILVTSQYVDSKLLLKIQYPHCIFNSMCIVHAYVSCKYLINQNILKYKKIYILRLTISNIARLNRRLWKILWTRCLQKVQIEIPLPRRPIMPKININNPSVIHTKFSWKLFSGMIWKKEYNIHTSWSLCKQAVWTWLGPFGQGGWLSCY